MPKHQGRTTIPDPPMQMGGMGGPGMMIPEIGGGMSGDQLREMQEQQQRAQQQAMDVSIRMGVMQTVAASKWSNDMPRTAQEMIDYCAEIEQYVRDGRSQTTAPVESIDIPDHLRTPPPEGEQTEPEPEG